jgi:hypothetical protein
MRTIWMTLATGCFAAMMGCSGGGAGGGTAGAGAAGGASGAGGTPAGGAAALLCPEGFADCDGDSENGCEAALRTSVKSCGGCGVACPSGAAAVAVCAAGACAIACDPGAADCDGKPENGCEVAVTTDLKSCGACGVACAASCSNGTCDVTVLAKDEASPVNVAVDATAVYWVSFGSGTAADGAMKRADKTGGPATAIAPGLVGPRALVLDGDAAYCVTTDGSILRVPKAGGGATELATQQASPVALAVGQGVVYWANAGTPPAFADSAIMALDLQDPGATPLVVGAIGSRISSIVVAGDQLYATVFGTGQDPDGALVRFAAAVPSGPAGPNEKPVLVAGGLVGPHALVAGAGAVWLASKNAILSVPVAGAGGGGSEGEPLVPRAVAPDLTHPPALLAFAGERLWWTTLGAVNGEVRSMKLDGSDLRTRARNLTYPRGIAAGPEGSNGDLYWVLVSTTGGPGTGQVVRAAKE